MFGRDPIKPIPNHRHVYEILCTMPTCPNTEIQVRRGNVQPGYGETCVYCQSAMSIRPFVDAADAQSAARNAKIETDRHLKEIRRAVERLGLDEEASLDQAVAHALSQIDTWRTEADEANEILEESRIGLREGLSHLTMPG